MRNTSFALAVVAGTLGLWLPAGSSSAQTLEPSKTLLNPSPDNFDLFGTSVAVSGNNLLIGATGNRSVYLFDAATGNLQQTLLNPSPDFNYFGGSVAVSGNNLLVGAPNDDNQGEEGSGAAFLFDATMGDLRQTLLNPSPARYDYFGGSVAVSGNHLLVGAVFDGGVGESGSGAAYLFDAATGDLLQTLLNPSPDNFDLFGTSVAVSGNNLLVGASNDDNQGEEGSGAAYLFDAATGDLLQTLLNPSPDRADSFGTSVAVSGNNLLVGAPGNEDQGEKSSGAAYLFDAATGDLLQTLLNPSPDNGDFFGISVAVSGNNLLVGASNEDSQGVRNSGAAYLFDAATGDLLQTLLNPSPVEAEDFGGSVAVSGNNLLIGASYDDNQGATFSGAAYLYQLASPPTTVPEPGSALGLLEIGTLGATALRQRRHS